MPGWANRARVFPATGWAAMQAHEEVLYCTWCALGTLDATGSGKVGASDARSLLASWRGIDPRSIRRIIADGTDRYWTLGTTRDGVERMFMTGIVAIMRRLNLEHERPPRLVPLDRMRTVREMRAQLYAAVHELPGHSGRMQNAPLARATKREITGVPESSQRRYDRDATELVQEVYVREDDLDGIGLVGAGRFIGKGGAQYRRLADYRAPADQWSASRTASRHASKKVRRLRETEEPDSSEPLAYFRGQSDQSGSPSPTRTFYAGPTEAAALKRAQEARARGRITLGWGITGAMQFKAIEL